MGASLRVDLDMFSSSTFFVDNFESGVLCYFKCSRMHTRTILYDPLPLFHSNVNAKYVVVFQASIYFSY